MAYSRLDEGKQLLRLDGRRQLFELKSDKGAGEVGVG